MKDNKGLIRFLAIAAGGYLLWFIGYELWLKPKGVLDFWLTNLVTEHGVAVLRAIGYEVGHQIVYNKHYISNNTSKILAIANPCNGLVLYPLFAGFIIATPGNWKLKSMIIPIGCLAIYGVNIVRVVCLTIIQMKAPQYLDFNHKYTFTILVYSFIFLLWVTWIQKFSRTNVNPSSR